MITSPPGKAQRKDPQNDHVKEQASSRDAPLPGKLWRVLQRAEYNMLGKALIFEGNFVQVTKKGECISIHNHPNIVTMGILATSPTLPLPNLMIIAQEKRGTGAKRPKAKDLEITRLVPLELVEIFLDNLNEQRLKVQIRMGQRYYLQLYAPGRDENFLFDQWLRLIYLMHIARGRIRKPASFTSKESRHHMLQKSTLGLSKTHWLPAIMDEGSTGHLKEQLCQVHSSRETQSSVGSDITSKQSLLKSDLAAFSSPSSFGISGSEGCASTGQSLYTDPKVTRSHQAKKLVASQAGSPSFYRPELKKQSKQTSPRSTGVRSVEFATRPEGTGLPQPQVMSLPVGPSTAAQQISAIEPSQAKNVRLPSVTKPEEIPVSMTLSKSKYVPIKLQKSKKSGALVRPQRTKRKKPAVKSRETTPVPRKSLKSLTQGRQGVASQTSSVKPNKPLSRPVSPRAASASPAPVCHISVGVGPSETHIVSVATGPSEAFVVSTATAPSRPTSQGTQVTPEMCGTEVAPTKGQSEGWTHAPHSQMANRKSGKPSNSMSSRPKVSSSPSPKQGRSTSSSPTKKENLVALHRTEESVAVGPSTADNMFTSRPQSRALGTEKQSESKDKSHGQKVKNKESSRPSSATEKQKPSRSKETESKSKLKEVLSAAKQKSSVTFLTIYSVLSSSFERVKHSISRDDAKTLSRNPSKRVTISGVAGPSGKSVSQQEEVRDSAEDRPSASPRTGATSVAAAAVSLPMGKGASDRKAAESPKPSSQIATGEPLVTSRGPGKSISSFSPSKPGSKTSRAKLPRKPGEARHPPRSKISVATGHSKVDTIPVTAGPSMPDNRMNTKEPSMKPQQQSRRGDTQKSNPQQSALSGSSHKSRVLVGAGHSVTETKSMGRKTRTRGHENSPLNPQQLDFG